MNALISIASFGDAEPISRHALATGTAMATIDAAMALLTTMEVGGCIEAGVLRTAITEVFKGSDAESAWDWKTAYDTCEVASVLFMRKYGLALKRKVPPASALLPTLHKVASLLPTHTKHSIDSQTYQKFSTPFTLGWVAATAAQPSPTDIRLEPSAGTGMLGIRAEMMGAGLILNEIEPARADVLDLLFPNVERLRFDATQVDDHLDAALKPSVVLVTPPFSVLKGVTRTVRGAAMKHLCSALARRADGGRLVTLTGAGLSPDAHGWREAFVELQQQGRVVFTASIDGHVYAEHRTTVETRSTTIDKVPADDKTILMKSHALAPDVETLMAWVCADVPPRQAPIGATRPKNETLTGALAKATVRNLTAVRASRTPQEFAGEALAYESKARAPDAAARLSEAIYEPYRLQSIHIPGAKPHPTILVQSAAMPSVAPPRPSYRPHLPIGAVGRGLLSDAQFESVTYAGEAHIAHLSGWWTVDETYDVVSAVAEGCEGAFQFRRGWFLGDVTGAGTGRQAATIILDSRLKGRRKALWVSKSDKLLEDAQRDGRWVSPAWVANASTVGGVYLAPADAHAALLEGKTILSLAEGLQLRRVRVMGTNRIELSGFDEGMRHRLKAHGLCHEIITWKLRMFVPISADGVDVLSRVFDAYPIERVSEKETA